MMESSDTAESRMARPSPSHHQPSAVMLRFAAPVELAEYLFSLIRSGCRAPYPRLRLRKSSKAAALCERRSNNRRGCVRPRWTPDEKDLPPRAEFTANPRVIGSQLEIPSRRPLRACERRLDPSTQLRPREIRYFFGVNAPASSLEISK